MELSDLAKPFHADEYEWRIQRSGITSGKPWAMMLCYVTARAVMDRFDEVCGVENWKVRHDHVAGGVMAYIAVWIDDRDEWVEKSDGSDESKVEAFKGSISGALKRAAVVWGCGRLLYKLPSTFLPDKHLSTDKRLFPNRAQIGGKDYSWKAPELPSWALPAKDVKSPANPPTGDSGGKSAAAQTWEARGPDDVARMKSPDVALLSDAQLKKIHILRREIEVSEEAYRSVLLGEYGVESTKDLPMNAASHLIDRLAKRRRTQLENEAKKAFGDRDEATRMSKLEKSALGFLKGINNMDNVSLNDLETALEAEGLPRVLNETRKMVLTSEDEKELEQIVIKLEAVVAALAF